MFLGQYRHNIDEKGRLIIPARYRELLVDGAYVTQGFEHNLFVLRAPDFETIAVRINKLSLTDPETRELRRLLFSSAVRVDADNNGRILIPQFLRQFANLDSEAVVVGAGEYFEIWSPEHWEPQAAGLRDAETNTKRFAAIDLALGEG